MIKLKHLAECHGQWIELRCFLPREDRVWKSYTLYLTLVILLGHVTKTKIKAEPWLFSPPVTVLTSEFPLMMTRWRRPRPRNSLKILGKEAVCNTHTPFTETAREGSIMPLFFFWGGGVFVLLLDCFHKHTDQKQTHIKHTDMHNHPHLSNPFKVQYRHKTFYLSIIYHRHRNLSFDCIQIHIILNLRQL